MRTPQRGVRINRVPGSKYFENRIPAKTCEMLFLVRLGAGIIAARLRFANLQIELVLLVAAHVRVRHVVQRVAENITNITLS